MNIQNGVTKTTSSDLAFGKCPLFKNKIFLNVKLDSQK